MSGFGDRMLVTIHAPGTLTADLVASVIVPHACTIEQCIAVSSNTAAAGVMLGVVLDEDAYMLKRNSGISGSVVASLAANMVGGASPHLAAGDVLKITVDYNYNGGGGAVASANVSVTVVLREG